MKKTFLSVYCLFLAFSLLIVCNGSALAGQINTTIIDINGVMTSKLKDKLSLISASELIDVAVWINDIDHNAISAKAQSATNLSESDFTNTTSAKVVDDY